MANYGQSLILKVLLRYEIIIIVIIVIITIIIIIIIIIVRWHFTKINISPLLFQIWCFTYWIDGLHIHWLPFKDDFH